MTKPSSAQAMTDEEARAAIARGWGRRPPVGQSPDLDLSDAFNHLGSMADSAFDFDDLRDSEIARLDELANDAIEPIEHEVRRRVSEALVRVLIQFSAEHPDAPRARR